MKKILVTMRWLLLLSGLLIVILGFTMLFTPLENLVTLANFIGIFMLLSGISEMVSFCGEEKWHRSAWMLTSGIQATLCGVRMMFESGAHSLAVLMPFIFAVCVLTSSIMRIVGSLSLRSEGSSLWGWLLAFGISGTVFGFVLMFSPILSSIIASVSIALILISYGCDNIILFFCIKRIGIYIRERLCE